VKRLIAGLICLVGIGFAQDAAVPTTSLAPVVPSTEHTTSVLPARTQPRVFLQSASHGNQWTSRRDQSMEMSKDLEKNCPEVKITLNQAKADYTVSLNHIEHGFARDNQFQIADSNGDLLTKTKEGGSINKGVKRACDVIMTDWALKK
jgi:hypothetical protein